MFINFKLKLVLPFVFLFIRSLLLGVMALLRPLLLDVVPGIQQTSALALGRLANYNDDLAEAVVRADILPQLVYSLAEQNVMLYQFFNLYHRYHYRYDTIIAIFIQKRYVD